MKYRDIKFYKDYFYSFYLKQNEKVKLKITWTIDLIKRVENVPAKYFKHIKGTKGLYEIRVELDSDILEYSHSLRKIN